MKDAAHEEKLTQALDKVFDDLLACRKLTEDEKLIRNLQKATENILVAIKRASKDSK